MGLHPNRLFDSQFYRKQNKIPKGVSCLAHFVANLHVRRCRHHPFFHPEWYEWQNPDHANFESPLLHYLLVGSGEFRDPSPHIDMTSLMRRYDGFTCGADLIHAMHTGQISNPGPPGLIPDYITLVSAQRSLLNKISPSAVKLKSDSPKSKCLLYVQCAPESSFWKWFDCQRPRSWDLLVNCYSGHFPQANNADYVICQPGTKFTGMLNFWIQFKEIYDLYEYIFFIDDDLYFQFEDLDKFFSMILEHNLDIAQPSLSRNSHCIWKVFQNKQSTGVRFVNGVEIMMPALSKRAMDIALPYFMMSVSGFGLDLLLAKLTEQHGLTAAVVDDIVARHEKPIDQAGGAYYEYLREQGINSKLELWRLIEIYHLDTGFRELN